MTLRKWINIEQFIHSIKTVIAVAIGIVLTLLLTSHESPWIVVTIIVVMCAQIYVGSVLHKAFLRFLGTLIGCLFATLTIVLIGDTHLSMLITICLSSFIFSYVSSGENLSYASTLGAVTTAIIMLGHTPTISIASERFLEISIGLLIATLVSQFVLPIHARTHLRRAQATTLEQLRDYYKTVMERNEAVADYHDLEEPIILSLLKQRQLAKESKREPLGLEFNYEHFMQSLYCEREILRAITFMHNAAAHFSKTSLNFFQLPAVIAFNKMVIDALSTLIAVIDTQHAETKSIYISGVDTLKEALINNVVNTSPHDELFYINGLLFSAESLAESLKRLAVLYQIKVTH